MSADTIRRTLSCGRPGCECTKSGVKTHCPGPSHANFDRNPSLGVTERDGKTLVRCYGGCDQTAVVVVLQERDLWPRKDIDPRPSTNGQHPTRIVATYDYRDAAGGLSFQVVRMQPKDFRQRRPTKQGAWEWKTGDRSLLYHLPELLTASDTEIIWCCEGEKDVDRLISLGLVATTAAGGAGKWSDANSQWLTGRRVALLADNDVAGEKDVARKLDSLRLVAERVAIVALNGLPVGGDVSDWLDAGGTPEALVALAEAALAAAPEVRPTPISVEREPLPAFPTDILPDSLRRLIETASVAMVVPVEFLGLPLLVLAGSAIGNSWEIHIKGVWNEGPNLYGGIVAEPGAKKSPALHLAQRSLQRIQERLEQDHAERQRVYKEKLAEIERTPKADRGVPPDPPTFHHIYTTNATTEALAVMLQNSKGIVVIKDELVGWVSGMDQYHGGKGSDRSDYLSAWSRKPLKIDRKSDINNPIMVRNPCLSVIGGVQPDMVSKMILESGGDDGFVDRMLWAYPAPMADRWTEDDVDQGALVAVERLFENLFALQGAEQPDGTTAPRVARTDREARMVWAAWYDAHVAEESDESLPHSLKGAWSKFTGQYLRIALILHVAHAVDQGITVPALISGETMAKASVLVDFFKEHAKEALGAARTTRSSLEDRILRALRTRGPMTTTELYGVLGGGRIKSDRLKAALERLEEQAIVVFEIIKGAGAGRPGKRWSYPDKDPVPFRRDRAR